MGLLLTAFVAGCSGGGDGGGGATAQPGTLGVSLTDAPACGFDQVNVTVSRVRVHQSDNASENAAGWTDITLNPARKINLLDLNDPTQAPKFALESLGETSLSAGHYTQLRLVLAPNSANQPLANSIVLSGPPPSAEIPLDTPSAVQSGIKLIHQFTVASGQRVDLLLDFDACHSIVQTGNSTYKLKPVIKVIPFELNGIEGFVDTGLLGNNVIVSAQRNGDIVRATAPNANPLPNLNRGKFFLAHLAAGVNYDVVITADGSATAVIAGIPVPSSTSITTISTSGEPFTLNASSTHSIGGTVILNPVDDDGTVIVAAKQTLNSGPIVTVKSQTAALKTDPLATIGDYQFSLLALPTAAPSLGQYGVGALPIALSAILPDQSTVAGMYTVHGSAQTPTTVYTTQTPSPLSVNITGGSAIDQNFTLTTP